MTIIQFTLLNTNVGDEIEFMDGDTEYKISRLFSGSITIPKATKDNLVEYLTEKINAQSGEDVEAARIAASEILSYPITLNNNFCIRERADAGDPDSDKYLTIQNIEISDMYDTELELYIYCAEDPWTNVGIPISMCIDLESETITSFDVGDEGEVIDQWKSAWVEVIDTTSSGPAGWTGKDGYVDNDKSLESAFISNAKPGNSGSTATYRPDEDGFYYLYSVED